MPTPSDSKVPIDGQHQHGVGTAACLGVTGTGCRLLGRGSAKENCCHTKKKHEEIRKKRVLFVYFKDFFQRFSEVVFRNTCLAPKVLVMFTPTFIDMHTSSKTLLFRFGNHPGLLCDAKGLNIGNFQISIPT